MKRIIFILLMLPLFTQAQTGVKWDRYFFTGSMKIGGGLNGFANATLAAQDSGTYAESCAWLELGNDTSTKGFLVPRVIAVTGISSPKKGLIAFEISSGVFKAYNGTSWNRLDSGGIATVDSSIYATQAWVYSQSYATTTQLGTKQNFTDTSTWDVTLSDMYGYAAPISHTHTIAQVTGLQVALDSNAKAKDSVTKWVTLAQLYGFNYLTSYTETDPLSIKPADTAGMLGNYVLDGLYGLNKSGKYLLVDTSEVATQYDLTQVSGGGGDLNTTLGLGNTSALDILLTGMVQATSFNVLGGAGDNTITTSATGARLDTLPDLSGKFVMDRGSQTLYSKTIDGNSNTLTVLAASQLSGATPVANGGTGVTTTTAYGILAGGTTGTGAFQNVGVGNATEVLTSNGAGALPSFQPISTPVNQALTIATPLSGSSYNGSSPVTIGVDTTSSAGVATQSDIVGLLPIANIKIIQATLAGNGSTTVFTVAHGLGTTPTYATTIHQSLIVLNSRCWYTSSDATDVTITCGIAPASSARIDVLVIK